jgi:hypothetical protein
MRAVAHSPSFAKKTGIPQKVGADFEAADERKSFDAKPCDHDPVHRFDACPNSR